MNEKILIKYGFNASSKGFAYWCDALDYITKMEGYGFSITDFYNYEALKERCSTANIERSMRYCARPAQDTLQKTHNYKGNLGNTAILRILKSEI